MPASTSEQETTTIIKFVTNKCPTCGKKPNMLGIVCKCGGKFCMEHRMPEEHQCTYDFKTQYREKLLEKLTKSVAPKIIESH